MHIAPENILLKKGLAFQHNEQVDGAKAAGVFLFTLTANYFYIWNYSKHSLLCMLPLCPDSVAVGLPTERINKDGLAELAQLFDGLGAESLYVFGQKSYLQLTSQLVAHYYTQPEFLPHADTAPYPIGVERQQRLVLYRDQKVELGRLPASYGVCTQIKEIDGVCYGSFESGHILKLHYRQDGPLALEEAFLKYSVPILDFSLRPLLLAYFDRPLFADPGATGLAPTGKAQIRQIIRRHSLFILSSRSSLLVLNEQLGLLLKHPEKGALLSLGEKLFVSQESGALFELFITEPATRSLPSPRA